MRVTRRALLLGSAAALITACGGRSGSPVPVAAGEPGRVLIDTGEVRLHPGAWATYRELHG